jgi:hypothetical protein
MFCIATMLQNVGHALSQGDGHHADKEPPFE